MEQRDGIFEMERLAEVPAFPEPLDLPDWIPRPVGDLAQIKSDDLRRQRAEPEIWELLRRLVSDTRMKNVWSELQRRKRQDYQRTENFVHPARPSSCWFSEVNRARRRAEELRQRGGPQDEGESKRWKMLGVLSTLYGESFFHGRRPELPLQDFAMAFLFDQAFTLGQQDIRPVTIHEAKNTRRRYLKLAAQIRADAAEQERLKSHVASRRLWDAAFAYEELADAAAPPPGSQLLVMRQQRGEVRLKGFLLALADVTKDVFGTPLCGSLATTANVVFSRDDLTANAVRKMLYHAPRP